MSLTAGKIKGEWWVVDIASKKPIDGPFKTNACAWRRIDKILNEPYNRKEAAHDWSVSQYLKS
tara:strand:+ start:269 stop:457 length:189 start_codon:yes stop_codon:yes gene_type:complete